jgi:hypothetical protein
MSHTLTYRTSALSIPIHCGELAASFCDLVADGELQQLLPSVTGVSYHILLVWEKIKIEV